MSCTRRRKQTEEFEERGEERRRERGGSSGWLAKWVTAVAAAPSRRIFGNFFVSSRPSIFLDFLFSHLSFFIAIIARSAKLSIARNYGTSWETALMIKGALMPARSENPNWPGNFQRFSFARESRFRCCAFQETLRLCGRDVARRKREFREIILRKTYEAVGEMPSEGKTEMQMLDTKRMCKGK